MSFEPRSTATVHISLQKTEQKTRATVPLGYLLFYLPVQEYLSYRPLVLFYGKLLKKYVLIDSFQNPVLGILIQNTTPVRGKILKIPVFLSYVHN
jgi:hypothetical protein